MIIQRQNDSKNSMGQLKDLGQEVEKLNLLLKNIEERPKDSSEDFFGSGDDFSNYEKKVKEMRLYLEQLESNTDQLESRTARFSLIVFIFSALSALFAGVVFIKSLTSDFIPGLTIPNSNLILLLVPVFILLGFSLFSSAIDLFVRYNRRKKH
jgi:hypothetical protein